MPHDAACSIEEAHGVRPPNPFSIIIMHGGPTQARECTRSFSSTANELFDMHVMVFVRSLPQ